MWYENQNLCEVLPQASQKGNIATSLCTNIVESVVQHTKIPARTLVNMGGMRRRMYDDTTVTVVKL
jgi:hypothetical protein